MIATSARRFSASVLGGVHCLLVAIGTGATAGDMQPDRLDFGRVHVGARVEGSVQIVLDPKEAEAKEAQVVPPAFVRVTRVNVGTRKSGANTKGYCIIVVSIDTGRAFEGSGAIQVTVGGRRIEVPVAASIRPRDAGRPRVLVAETPFHRSSTADGTLFDPWRKLVVSAGLDVDYVEISRGSVLGGIDLATFDVVLLGGLGVIGLRDADVTELKRFAERGGRVIVTANAFFVGTVPKANELLEPYGLRMEDKESRVQNQFDIGPESITPCPFTEGVKALYFHRPSPTKVLNEDRTFVLVESPAGLDGCLLAYARAGEGEVLGLGESLWWSWIAKADNAVLFGNLLQKRPRAK